MTDTKHAGTPKGYRIDGESKWLLLPSGQEIETGSTECEMELWDIRSALAEENALRTNKLAEILRLEVDGEEFYIPAEPGPLGPFESLEEAAKEFMEFMDRTDKKMREENALLRKALESIACCPHASDDENNECPDASPRPRWR